MMKYLVDGLVLFVALFIQVFTLAIIIVNVFKITTTNKQKVIYATIISSICFIIRMYVSSDYAFLGSIASLLSTILCSKFIFNLPLSKSLLSGIILLVLSIPIELISGILVYKIFNIVSNTNNITTILPASLISDLWFIVIAFLIKLNSNSKKLSISPDFNDNRSLH